MHTWKSAHFSSDSIHLDKVYCTSREVACVHKDVRKLRQQWKHCVPCPTSDLLHHNSEPYFIKLTIYNPPSPQQKYILMIILSILSSTKSQCCYFNNPERNKLFQGDDCSSGDNYQCLPPKLHVYHLHACCQHPANRKKMKIHANSSWLENDQCCIRNAKEEFKGMQKLGTSVMYANCNIASSTCSCFGKC